MVTQDKLAEIVDQVPALDKRGTFTGTTWDDAIKIVDAVLAGGKESIVGVIAMLKDVDDGSDYKARYLLHVIAQYAAGKGAVRGIVGEAFASQLGGDRAKGVQGYLVRQLHVVGTAESAPALGKLLSDSDLYEYAAQALLAIRSGAVEEFRKALPGVKGALRLTVVQALGVLADAESAEALRKAAGEADRDTRLAAVWALARIGDPGAVEIALKAADVDPGFERIKATSNALLLAERLLAAGKKAESAKIYGHLKETRTDPSEAYVKDAAQEGLARTGA
jgi:hypothetical protein